MLSLGQNGSIYYRALVFSDTDKWWIKHEQINDDKDNLSWMEQVEYLQILYPSEINLQKMLRKKK